MTIIIKYLKPDNFTKNTYYKKMYLSYYIMIIHLSEYQKILFILIRCNRHLAANIQPKFICIHVWLTLNFGNRKGRSWRWGFVIVSIGLNYKKLDQVHFTVKCCWFRLLIIKKNYTKIEAARDGTPHFPLIFNNPRSSILPLNAPDL